MPRYIYSNRSPPEADIHEIMYFFEKYEALLKQLELTDKPQQIYTYEEMVISPSMQTTSTKRRWNGKQKMISNFDPTRAAITVSASGKFLPTMFVYKRYYPDFSLKDDLPPSCVYSVSDYGYLDDELFMGWLQGIFIKYCGSERPVLLLLDKREVHITSEIVTYAKEQQIEIFGFPQYTPHMLQPLSMGIISHVISNFTKICIGANRRKKERGIDDGRLPKAWQSAIELGETDSIVKSSFKQCGIYPLNSLVIDKTKFKETGTDGQILSESYKVDQKIAACITGVPEADIGEPCSTCGWYPHPIPSIRALEPDLQNIFQVPEEFRRDATVRRKLVLSHGDVLVTPEEAKKRKLKQKEVEVPEDAEQKTVGIGSVEKSSDGQESCEETYDDDNELCHVCNKHYPPMGKGKKAKRRKVEWVFCNECENWFHFYCVGINSKTVLEEVYICLNCKAKN